MLLLHSVGNFCMNVKASALLFLISPKLSRTFLELFNVICCRQ